VLTAHAAIVTASTGVLSSGKIKFQPVLPARHHEAIGKLGLGHYEHVAIEFSGNVLGLRSDDLVYLEFAFDAEAAHHVDFRAHFAEPRARWGPMPSTWSNYPRVLGDRQYLLLPRPYAGSSV
jgi:flavin-dependent amine oxidoreductase